MREESNINARLHSLWNVIIRHGALLWWESFGKSSNAHILNNVYHPIHMRLFREEKERIFIVHLVSKQKTKKEKQLKICQVKGFSMWTFSSRSRTEDFIFSPQRCEQWQSRMKQINRMKGISTLNRKTSHFSRFCVYSRTWELGLSTPDVQRTKMQFLSRFRASKSSIFHRPSIA